MVSFLIAARADVPSSGAPSQTTPQQRLDAAGPCKYCQLPMQLRENVYPDDDVDHTVAEGICTLCRSDLDQRILDQRCY